MTTFKNGDRVTVARRDDETYWAFGLTGTVVKQDPKKKTGPAWARSDLDVLVEFSAKDAKHQGHDDLVGDGRTNRWWVNGDNLDKVTEDTLSLGSSEVPNTFKAGSKTSAIFSHLLKGKSISNLEAQTVYGNWRLSDSIHNIRKAGYDVETLLKTDEAGKEYSSYRLASKSRHCSATPPRLVKAA